MRGGLAAVIRARSLASAPLLAAPLLAASLLAASLGALACGRGKARAADASASGKELAERYCQSCHLLPSPTLLDRGTWDRWVLPRMARRLGLRDVGWPADDEPLEGGEGGRLVREAGVFPDTPQLSHEAWDRLAEYYLHAAPDSQPRPVTPPVAVGLPGFHVRTTALRIPNPTVTLVHVDSARGRIFVGDATADHATLSELDGAGRVVGTSPLPSPASHLQVMGGDTLALTLMGYLHPSDAPRGSVVLVPAWKAGAAPTFAWRVDSLQRPVFASWADLSGDGVADVVVSEFGNLTGRLAWYEHLPGGGSRRHVIAAQPGAMNTVVRDVDGDGRLDVLALTAQGDEGVSLFRGRAGGELARERLLRFPPSYGSTSMELADVDGDGRQDIVYTNGDAGDYPGPTKPYHGVHVFLADARGRFAERYFFPMPGAFRAIARDFDGDGDVDLAAIAFYPDLAAAAPLSFVYLENLGGLRFRASTFAEADRGRWLTMDAGDVDGDGDADLVLGSFAMPDALGDPRATNARWQRPGAPTVVILENLARRPASVAGGRTGAHHGGTARGGVPHPAGPLP